VKLQKDAGCIAHGDYDDPGAESPADARWLIEKYGFRHAVEDLAETINMSGKYRCKLVIVGFDGHGPVSGCFSE
jgi:hypothetical protein